MRVIDAHTHTWWYFRDDTYSAADARPIVVVKQLHTVLGIIPNDKDVSNENVAIVRRKMFVHVFNSLLNAYFQSP